VIFVVIIGGFPALIKRGKAAVLHCGGTTELEGKVADFGVGVWDLLTREAPGGIISIVYLLFITAVHAAVWPASYTQDVLFIHAFPHPTWTTWIPKCGQGSK
jgi:hypothetical protein